MGFSLSYVIFERFCCMPPLTMLCTGTMPATFSEPLFYTLYFFVAKVVFIPRRPLAS